MNSYPNNLKRTKISTFSKKEEKRYWKGMRENRKIAPRFDSSRRFISTIRSMAERGKKRGGIPSNRGSRSKRRGVEFTERRGGWTGSCPVSLLARPLVPWLAGRCFHSVMQRLKHRCTGVRSVYTPRAFHGNRGQEPCDSTSRWL